VKRRRLVRVPASTANLGPGFDSLAAAIGLYLELEVEETGGELVVECDVPGVPLGPDNLCVRAFEAIKGDSRGLTFRIRSEIPLSAGLGSSAAALVAGLVAADSMYELDAPLFETAAMLEGHPDNVAAALLGGFVICAGETPERFDPAPGIEGVLATPPDTVATEEARAALPDQVPMADAVHNIGHAALLILGLSRGPDLSLVGRGLDDRLHQPRREAVYPRSMELLRQARDLGAIGATISGAGPTVLFWCHWEQTGTVFERVRDAAPDCEVRRAQFVPGGADVKSL
jgi:homoserine kinase